MPDHIVIDNQYLVPDVTAAMVQQWQPQVTLCHDRLHQKTGPGHEFLGWLHPETCITGTEQQRLQQEVARLREISEVMVVVGIGGSYLGARALIEAMSYEQVANRQVYFAGYQLSASYHQRLLEEIAAKDVCLNVISKSGTTLEPALAFRFFRDFMEHKYGKQEAARRIIATTDRQRGTLKAIADHAGYSTFVVPDDIGGRYSVTSPVGLVPIAYAGFDIAALLDGLRDQARLLQNPDLADNHAYYYAVVRNILYRQGKLVEILANFEPALFYFGEWWKQLYGESEGKDGMGLFPTTANFTTDLHSLGQYIQAGRRHLLESFLLIETPKSPRLLVSNREGDDDNLNYLATKSMEEINHHAYAATAQAHHQGGVPNLSIHVSNLQPYTLGQLVFFFEKACAMSGYLLGVNPFDQPGVECYKKNMFSRLGRP